MYRYIGTLKNKKIFGVYSFNISIRCRTEVFELNKILVL